MVEPFGHREGHPSGYPKYLSRALAETGADVTLVTFGGLRGRTEEDRKVRHLSVLSHGGALASLSWRLGQPLRIARPLHLFASPWQTFSTFILALWLNRARRYDVIHVLDASVSPLSFLALASALKGCNLVYTLSHPPIREYLNNRPGSFWASLRHREHILADLEVSRVSAALARLLYRIAASQNQIAFVCHAEQVRRAYARSTYYDKVTCIPWGVERPAEQPLTQAKARELLGLGQEGRLLLSFGINHPWKNFKVIFEAIEGLPQDFKLLFAGEIVARDAAENDPRRWAQEYGWTADTIIIDRYIPEEEMPRYFCAADAIILSYTKGFVGASGILSHAAAFHLPVIASDVGQLGEFVRKYNLGMTFTAEDALSLRQAIQTFLSLSEEERDRLRNSAARFAAARSWDQVAAEHPALYRSLSEQSKGAAATPSMEQPTATKVTST